jgi:hypothetical protein
MTAPSYRLDTICANLIERLEGARRTWSGDPDGARRELTRIADEQLTRILAEHDELVDTPGWSALARREVMETFLPRYLRLAVDHNALEERGYDAWRQGDPIARIVGTVVSMTVALGCVRLVHHPAALVLVPVALAVPFVPEIRRLHFRRKYRVLLQEVVDDMGRIQGELDRFPAGAGADSDTTRPRPQPQTERPQ